MSKFSLQTNISPTTLSKPGQHFCFIGYVHKLANKGKVMEKRKHYTTAIRVIIHPFYFSFINLREKSQRDLKMASNCEHIRNTE